MKVISMKELDNGMCELDCEFTEEERDILIEFAVNRILEEQLKKEDIKEENE